MTIDSTPLHVTQGQLFFSRVSQVRILGFPSPRPVAIQRLKSPVCLIIYQCIVGCIYFPRVLTLCELSCKQPYPRFELGL